MKIVYTLCGVVLFLFLAYFSWNLQRTLNFKFGYENSVISKIKETVKPECIINGN